MLKEMKDVERQRKIFVGKVLTALKYVEKHEDKIIYIRHSNRGQSDSINRGVLNSVGEFITIIDGDDEYKSHHLSSCLREVKEEDLI